MQLIDGLRVHFCKMLENMILSQERETNVRPGSCTWQLCQPQSPQVWERRASGWDQTNTNQDGSWNTSWEITKYVPCRVRIKCVWNLHLAKPPSMKLCNTGQEPFWLWEWQEGHEWCCHKDFQWASKKWYFSDASCTQEEFQDNACRPLSAFLMGKKKSLIFF